MQYLIYLLIWPTFGEFGILKLLSTFILSTIPILIKLNKKDYKLNKSFSILIFAILISVSISFLISIFLGNGRLGFNTSNFPVDIIRIILITIIPLIIFDVSSKLQTLKKINLELYTKFQIKAVNIILIIQLLQAISIIFRVPYSETIIFTRFSGPFSYLDESSLFVFFVFLGIFFNLEIHNRLKKLFYIFFIFIPICIGTASKSSLLLLLGITLFLAFELITKLFNINFKFLNDRFKLNFSIIQFAKLLLTSLLLILGINRIDLAFKWLQAGSLALFMFLSNTLKITDLNINNTAYIAGNIDSFSTRIDEIELCFNNGLIDYLIPSLPIGAITYSGLSTRVQLSGLDLLCTYGSIPTLLIVLNISLILNFYLFSKISLRSYLISLAIVFCLGSFTSILKSFKILFLLSFMAGSRVFLDKNLKRK